MNDKIVKGGATSRGREGERERKMGKEKSKEKKGERGGRKKRVRQGEKKIFFLSLIERGPSHIIIV